MGFRKDTRLWRREQKQGYSAGIQICSLRVLEMIPARTTLAFWTRKGCGQAEIHLSGRADAAELEVQMVLGPLPLGTTTLFCKS